MDCSVSTQKARSNNLPKTWILHFPSVKSTDICQALWGRLKERFTVYINVYIYLKSDSSLTETRISFKELWAYGFWNFCKALIFNLILISTAIIQMWYLLFNLYWWVIGQVLFYYTEQLFLYILAWYKLKSWNTFILFTILPRKNM